MDAAHMPKDGFSKDEKEQIKKSQLPTIRKQLALSQAVIIAQRRQPPDISFSFAEPHKSSVPRNVGQNRVAPGSQP